MASDGSKQDLLVSKLPRELPSNFLKEITSHFSSDQIIGQSVFGTVYKGILPEGGIIAVKKLAENSPVAQGTTFVTEVTNLMALKHENIVELVSFCAESQKRVVQHNGRYVIVDFQESFLCFKYAKNGSLDKHLFAESSTIRWDTRFKIIKGISQGLHFLHNELDGPLIHMSLLPTSIWLDENWDPKIAEFGLSRLFGQEQTRMNTINVMGQNGYMAPEYLYKGEISTKCDIYSLGMLILEITTGEKNCSSADDRSARKFVHQVHKNWATDGKISSKYPSLDIYGRQQVKACIDIGLKCLEVDRNKRPTIKDVLNKLIGKHV